MVYRVSKIIISGVLGFIGSQLAVAHADAGDAVAGIARKPGREDRLRGRKVHVIHEDIRDITVQMWKDLLCEAPVFYHCASTTHNYHLVEKSEMMLDIETNVVATQKILIAMAELGPKYSPKMVYVSTFFVNGNPPSLPVTAETQECPLGSYGATKLCAENLCKAYVNAHGLDITIARLTGVYGPYERGADKKKAALNKMLCDIANFQPINLYEEHLTEETSPKRDFVEINDVVSALQIISCKGAQSQVYYVAPDENVPFRRLIDVALEQFGGKINFVKVPEFHSQVGIGDFHADNTPLKNLGWSPQVSISEGISRTLAYYASPE